MFRSSSDQPAERDSVGLPYSDLQHIVILRQEYEDAVQRGGEGAMDKCFNLTWALVHSYDKTDVQRGLQLCLAMLSGEGSNKRELLYLKAVGEFRSRHHLSARQTLKDLLSQYPDFRQAQTLLDAVEQEVVKDGLIGLGAGAAIVGLVAGIAVAASRRR